MSNFKIPGSQAWRFAASMTVEGFGFAGWTESGWIPYSIANDLTSARTVAQGWAAVRLALSMSDTSILKLRVWQTQQTYRGAGLLVQLDAGNVGTYAPGGLVDSLPPVNKFELRLQNFLGLGVTDFLGSIPDDQISVDGAYNPTGAWVANMAAYQTFLKNNCVFVRKNVLTDKAVTVFSIDDIQVVPYVRSRKSGQAADTHHAVPVRS